MNIAQLKKQLAAPELVSNFLLQGDDAYLQEQALHAIRQAFLPADESGMAWSVHDAEDSAFDMGAIVTAARTPPIFSPRQVFVIRNAGRLKKPDLELLAAYAGSPSERSVLVALLPVGRKGDGRDNERETRAAKAARDLKAYFQPVACDTIRSRKEALAHLLEMARARGLAFDSQSTGYGLLDAVGLDLQELDSTIDRLDLSLQEGGRRTITPALLERQVTFTRSTAHYELEDHIGNREAGRALGVVADLYTGNPQFEPLWLIRSLSRFLGRLYEVRGCIARKLPKEQAMACLRVSHAYQWDKYTRFVAIWPEIEIDRALALLARTELRIKTSRLASRLLLEDAILGLCSDRGGRRPGAARQRA